mgnify:CR=1 FL=1
MGFTVSGISRSVATLEKELGFALLYRAKSGVQPTAECRQLLPSVRELLFAQERLEQTAAKVRGADCGTIVIGTAYNCYYEWVTRMMAAFRTRHPAWSSRSSTAPAASWPRCCWITARFLPHQHRDSLPVWLPIRQDELMVLLPKNHPLADRESFPVESLKTEPFIDSYPGMETDITLIFDKLKARPDARYSTMDITATYAMVSAGLGISVNNAINHQGGYPASWSADESPPDDGDRSRLRREPRPRRPGVPGFREGAAAGIECLPPAGGGRWPRPRPRPDEGQPCVIAHSRPYLRKLSPHQPPAAAASPPRGEAFFQTGVYFLCVKISSHFPRPWPPARPAVGAAKTRPPTPCSTSVTVCTT